MSLRSVILGLALGAAISATTLVRPVAAGDPPTTFVGPTQILFADADTVLFVRTREWQSAYVRNQEKLLLTSLRLSYWRRHLPADMRRVYDSLGYPVSRVLQTPVGHTEEWWYYGLLDPPLRFRDGELLDVDRFEALLSR